MVEGGEKENPSGSARQSSLEPKWPGRPRKDIEGLIVPSQHNHLMSINNMPIREYYTKARGHNNAVRGCNAIRTPVTLATDQ